MSFFSKITRSLSGGWADVSLDVSPAERGENLAVSVDVDVKSESISIDRVYVKLRCVEKIKIDDHPISQRDDEGKRVKIDVRTEEVLMSEDLSLSGPLQLEAHSTQSYDGEIPIPTHLPASFEGKHAWIEWSAIAALEMKGNDPDSDWQRLAVK